MVVLFVAFPTRDANREVIECPLVGKLHINTHDLAKSPLNSDVVQKIVTISQ